MARAVGETLLLAVLVIVVMLSHRRGAILAIMLGVTAMMADVLFSSKETPLTASVLERGGNIVLFSSLTWVVAHAVYAPGRITLRRLQGAVGVYLNLATIFASAYRLIWELNPAAFTNRATRANSPPCCISASPR